MKTELKKWKYDEHVRADHKIMQVEMFRMLKKRKPRKKSI